MEINIQRAEEAMKKRKEHETYAVSNTHKQTSNVCIKKQKQ